MTEGDSKPKSRLDLAASLLDFALSEAKEGYSKQDWHKVRDAAEKAYMAVVEATNHLMESKGQVPEPGPNAHGDRHRFLQENERWDIEKDYGAFTDILHGAIWLQGLRPREEYFMGLMEDVRGYVRRCMEG